MTENATPAAQLQEQVNSMERLGAGIAALGELMQTETSDWTKTETVYGLGYLLEAVGEVLFLKADEARKIMGAQALTHQGDGHE